MSDDNNQNTDPKPKPTDKVKSGVKSAAAMADKATTTIEGTQNAFSAIKWVAISIVCITILALAWLGYKVFYKPVAAVGDAAGSVVEAVGDGAGAIKDGASDVINRLVISPNKGQPIAPAANAAFAVLSDMDETKPEGMKDRMFRRTSFKGSEGKVCKLALDFGTGDINAYAAADHKHYATAKSLGSLDDRIMRLVIKAPDDDIEMVTVWDNEAKAWEMKWKKTVVKKPISDELAANRIQDILSAVPGQCGSANTP